MVRQGGLSSECLEVSCQAVGSPDSRTSHSPVVEPVPNSDFHRVVVFLPASPCSSLNPMSHSVSRCISWCTQTASPPAGTCRQMAWLLIPQPRLFFALLSERRLEGNAPRLEGRCGVCTAASPHPSTALPGTVRNEKLCTCESQREYEKVSMRTCNKKPFKLPPCSKFSSSRYHRVEHDFE